MGTILINSKTKNGLLRIRVCIMIISVSKFSIRMEPPLEVMADLGEAELGVGRDIE